MVLIGVDGWNATAPIDCRKRNEQSSKRTNECQLTAISSAAAGVDVDVVIVASQCWAQLLLLPARSHHSNACACVRQGAHDTQHSWVANFCDHIWSCFKANRWLRAANVASSPRRRFRSLTRRRQWHGQRRETETSAVAATVTLCMRWRFSPFLRGSLKKPAFLHSRKRPNNFNDVILWLFLAKLPTSLAPWADATNTDRHGVQLCARITWKGCMCVRACDKASNLAVTFQIVRLKVNWSVGKIESICKIELQMEMRNAALNCSLYFLSPNWPCIVYRHHSLWARPSDRSMYAWVNTHKHTDRYVTFCSVFLELFF